MSVKRSALPTLTIQAPRAFVDSTLGPENLKLQAALHPYLNDATERSIREEVYRDLEEAKRADNEPSPHPSRPTSTNIGVVSEI